MSPEVERRAPAEAADASLPKTCPSCRSRYAADALFCAFDGSPLATSPAALAALAASDVYIGHEIVGPIEIRQLVGIGAMGRVYRGFQKGIDRDVAVKILHRELSANPTVVARFHREAKVASRLAHPNVVHVLLTGQLPDGAMYMVMEYLDGMSLQSALAASGGAMPLPRALHAALGICDAVGEAHAQGIVHRDLKPENVMLVKRGDDPDFVKVLDFGIARLNWGDPQMASAAGLIFGTARYISPEGAQGEKVGPQGDVYSIATMLYQMLSGRTPFDGDQAVALLVHQIHDPPPPLKSVPRASYVPDPLIAVVMKNLAKRPEDRAANARAFGRDLLDAGVESGLSAQDMLVRPGLAGGTRQPQPSAVHMPSMQRTQQPGLEPQLADRLPSGVSETVFDAPAPSRTGARSSPGTGRRTPARTEMAEPAVSVDMTMDEQRQPVATPPPSTAAPLRAAASRLHVSSLLTTPGERHEGLPPRRPLFLVVVGCFLVGALGMAVVGAKTGVLGTKAVAAPTVEGLVARANDALLHRRWDTPRTDSVRGVTDEGLALWPNEPQLLRIRALAANDILKTVAARRDEGNLGEALRLAKLAYVLDPGDVQAQKIAADMEALAQSPPSDAVPPLAMGGPAPPAMGAARGLAASAAAAQGPASSPAGAKAAIDASNAKPGVGQPVDFTAKVTLAGGAAPGKVEGAAFGIAGPGIAPGTRLDAAADESGAYRATFSFLQAGRFDVTFTAKADGAAVRTVRSFDVASVAVVPPRMLPPPASTAERPAVLAPASPPASSAKWL